MYIFLRLHLRTLILRKNSIYELSPELTTLGIVTLDLAHNDLKEIMKLPKLEHLNISDNKLGSLNVGVSKRLKVLDVSRNPVRGC